MSTKPRGRCPVCGFSGALRADGTLYRHWAGLGDHGGLACRGWQMPPLTPLTPPPGAAVESA